LTDQKNLQITKLQVKSYINNKSIKYDNIFDKVYISAYQKKENFTKKLIELTKSSIKNNISLIKLNNFVIHYQQCKKDLITYDYLIRLNSVCLNNIKVLNLLKIKNNIMT
jgi:hypothetical protein